MKNKVVFLWCLVLLAASCEKDQDVIYSNVSIQEENILSFYKSAVIECDLRSNATLCNNFIEYAKSDKIEYKRVEVKKIQDKYFAILTDLTPNTSYIFRYFVGNKFSSKIIEQNSKFMTTSQTSIPTVFTDTASSITKSSAIVHGRVIDDGGEKITEFGVVYATSSFPTIDDQKVSFTNANWDFTATLTELNAETHYYVRTYAINNNGVSYGNQILFITTLKLPYESVAEYIDLGLSVKWATHNIGASKPEMVGLYFAWGEVETKDRFNWHHYIWSGENEYEIKKYCTDKNYTYNWGIPDYIKTLNKEDDAAYVKWGNKWHIPTKSEWNELYTKCNWFWTHQNGVSGYKVVSKKNKKSIFIPVTGYKNGSSDQYMAGGFYWSSSLYSDIPSLAYGFLFDSDEILIEGFSRDLGCVIRPVCK